MDLLNHFLRVENTSITCQRPDNVCISLEFPRRIEDKADARSLCSSLISVRMDPPPASKRVPMNFFGWLVFQEATFDQNIFSECALMVDRIRGA